MKNVVTIAKNTFRESIRQKILLAILAFALLFIASTIMLGSLSLGEDIKVIKDFGLAGIYLFSLIISIFLGTSLISTEIDRHTIYIILSRPVSSIQIIIGKFIGLLASVLLSILIMTAVYLAIVVLKGGGFDAKSLIAILLQLFEISLFIALSILFSTFATPLASALYAVLILFIGHSLTLILQGAQKSTALFKYLAFGLYYVLPNLEKFNIRNIVVHSSAINSKEIIFSILYGIAYTAIVLYLANLSLKKQEY